MLSPCKADPLREIAFPAEPSLQASLDAFQDIDRAFHGGLASLTGGVAPGALAGAITDWSTHIALAPGKRMELASRALSEAYNNVAYATECVFGLGGDPCVDALPQDKRFAADDWQHYPFNVMVRSFLSAERWWELATRDVRGVSRHHEEVVSFIARQIVDVAAPSNFIATNPEVIAQTQAEFGVNLVRGACYLLNDLMRLGSERPPAGAEPFQGRRECRRYTGQSRSPHTSRRSHPVHADDEGRAT